MSELIQPVKEGKIVQPKNDKADIKPKNNLDKNAFLQLLTTQMKYQDPLNPNTDTEYIAQLATFSQLEQLQNLSAITTNTQAFNLVGKDVIVKTENSSGNITYINGRVDFVTMTGKDTKISVNGSFYSIDQLDSVISSEYITEQNLPSITQKTDLKYDASKPKDLSFEVKLGSGNTIADDVAIVINDRVIDTKLVDVNGNKVTIKKEALADLDNGNYNLIIAFNDPMLTTIRDKVTLQVVNAIVKENNDTNQEAADKADQTQADD